MYIYISTFIYSKIDIHIYTYTLAELFATLLCVCVDRIDTVQCGFKFINLMP